MRKASVHLFACKAALNLWCADLVLYTYKGNPRVYIYQARSSALSKSFLQCNSVREVLLLHFIVWLCHCHSYALGQIDPCQWTCTTVSNSLQQRSADHTSLCVMSCWCPAAVIPQRSCLKCKKTRGKCVFSIWLILGGVKSDYRCANWKCMFVHATFLL